MKAASARDCAVSAACGLLLVGSLLGSGAPPKPPAAPPPAPLQIPPPPVPLELQLEAEKPAPAHSPAHSQAPAQPLPAPPHLEMPPPLTETIPAHAFALPPLPEISSLLPVEQLPRPALIQLPATANSRGNAAAPSPSPPSVQTLAFGVGAGKQPAPRYPREALRRGQQGSVEILFSVNRDGAVETAEILSPSPWPLLNQEALRVVRERWNFPPGECRRYRVPIRFKLEK